MKKFVGWIYIVAFVALVIKIILTGGMSDMSGLAMVGYFVSLVQYQEWWHNRQTTKNWVAMVVGSVLFLVTMFL